MCNHFYKTLNQGLARSTEVLISFEVRWFYADRVPEPVEKWFRTGLGVANSLPLNPEPPREDYYLPVEGSDFLGIKLSRKRLELKERRQDSKHFYVEGGISGLAEYWTRWEWNDNNPGLGLEALLNRFNWIRVNKSRLQRKYIVLSDGLSEIPNTRFDADCAIEITGLELHGYPWWSLGLDSYSDYAWSYRNLSVAAIQLLSNFPMAKPKMDHSYGYPNWILKNSKSLC
jgi:hypothetical protein